MAGDVSIDGHMNWARHSQHGQIHVWGMTVATERDDLGSGRLGRWDRRATDKPVGAKESVGEE